MRDLYQIFRTCSPCCLSPWLGPPAVGDAIRRRRVNFAGVLPIENALYGPYSGMNFATKDQFGLNLLFLL